ncbi:hypothetical protein QQX98_007076 [Neonectria punicea]|uniref:Xylanolytic transcriptional activator regulatory domain-containing protein n=1 Tax=Neonectria punicea TaxID=979145 RepID=A0ABR1GYV6_9HYPO
MRKMQALMAGDDSAGEKIDWDLSSTEPDYSEYLLVGDDSLGSSVEDLQPSPSQMMRLWQAYLGRVHPLTKIIHAPSIQSYVVQATGGTAALAGNVQALLFGIYGLAAISLTEEECINVLGCPVNAAYRRFSAGLRMTLLRIEFLKTHDLTTLQALVLYLKMGLHRDGEALGLSPFETEIRRRIWWHIVLLDAKSAIDSGLSPSLLPGPSDCKMPANLNDSDMNPDATEPYRDRDGPTEMIVCLLLYKMGEFLLKTPGMQTMVFNLEVDAIGPGSQPGDVPPGRFEELTEEMKASLDDIMERCSSPGGGSIHELAMQVRFSILDKIHGMLRPPHEQPEWGTDITSPQDNLFKIAITAVDHAMKLYQSTENTGFLWFMRMHFPHKIFFYLVSQLCHRTSGTLSDRAWEQVPGVFHYHQELADMSQKSNMALATVVVRAWKARQTVMPNSAEQLPKAAECIQHLQRMISKDASGCFPFSMFTNPAVDLGTEAYDWGPLAPPLPLGDSIQNDGILSDYDLWMAFQGGLDLQGNPSEGLDFGPQHFSS